MDNREIKPLECSLGNLSAGCEGINKTFPNHILSPWTVHNSFYPDQ